MRWPNSRQVISSVPGKERVRVYAIDITLRKAAEERLEQARRLSEALNRLDEALHSTLDADAILELLVREGSAALGCGTAAMSARKQGQ